MPGQQDGSVLVERHLFGLVDEDGSDPPWPAGAMPDEDEVYARPNRIDFRSAGEDHVAAVRLESWDGEPDDAGPDWSEVDELTVSLSSGRVRLWTLTDGPAGAAFGVGPPGSYRLQVLVAGVEDVLTSQFEGTPIPDGTERYRLRFRRDDG
jgi:hypothetical protein